MNRANIMTQFIDTLFIIAVFLSACFCVYIVAFILGVI